MRHRLLAALCCFLMLPVLSGCRYSHEISEMAYTVALGLDKGENGAIRVTFQFAKPTMLAGEDSGGGDSAEDGEADGTAKDASTALVTVDSVDIYSALSVVGNILSKQINLSHTKLLLFSAELAQDGIMDYITMLMKNSQFSPKTFVAVSLCSAQEYLKTVNPSLEERSGEVLYAGIFERQQRLYPDRHLAGPVFQYHRARAGAGGSGSGADAGICRRIGRRGTETGSAWELCGGTSAEDGRKQNGNIGHVCY